MDTPSENAEPEPASVSQLETCPRCGEEAISRRELGTASDGIEILADGYGELAHDRRCGACALTWQATSDGSGVLLANLQDLFSIADVTSNEDLGPWLEARLEADWTVWIDHPEEDFVVGMGRLGIFIDFPITLDDLLERLEGLKDDVAEHELQFDGEVAP